MVAREICVVFTGYPMGTNSMSEKLRMAVGLTINNDISLKALFLGNARHALNEVDEAAIGMGVITKHIETLSLMKAEILVEEGNGFSVLPTIKYNYIPSSSVEEIIGRADVVIH